MRISDWSSDVCSSDLYFSFYINGPWNIAEFRKRLPSSLPDAWMTMPLPGPEGPGASVAGGTRFVVFRYSEHKDAAWKLVAHLSDPEVRARFHGLTGNLPPRRSPWEDQNRKSTRMTSSH